MRRLAIVTSLAACWLSGPPTELIAADIATRDQCSRLLEEEDCVCTLPLSSFDPATTAILSDISGRVEITTANQYSPADPYVPLNIGDGVIVLEDSSALLSFGPICKKELPEQSTLVVRAVDDCACAAFVETQRTAAALPFLGLGAIGVGIILLDEDPASP